MKPLTFGSLFSGFVPSHRLIHWSGSAMSYAEDSPASKPRICLPFMEGDLGWQDKLADYGSRCCGSCDWSGLAWWLWKTWPGQSPGLIKSRLVWRMLGTEFLQVHTVCRLRMLVLLINAGVCSGLPTLRSRDCKYPGSQNHPRLTAARGEPLTETFGFLLSPELCEWMMGFPVGWTDLNE